jgi:predicted transcriptional regulator
MSLATSLPTTLEGLSQGQVAKAPRKSRTTKAASPQGDASTKAPRGQKVSFYLSPQVIRRLKITATAMDSDMSKVVEDVLAESPTLRRWVLSDRAKVADQATVEVSSD